MRTIIICLALVVSLLATTLPEATNDAAKPPSFAQDLHTAFTQKKTGLLPLKSFSPQIVAIASPKPTPAAPVPSAIPSPSAVDSTKHALPGNVPNVAVTVPVSTPSVPTVRKSPTVASQNADDHIALMDAVGIAESDRGYVDYIINHEGSWRPCVVGGGTIDCTYDGGKSYGICQAEPGSKMASAGDDWRTNPLTQLKWCNSYAQERYGSWENAYAFWVSNRWW